MPLAVDEPRIHEVVSSLNRKMLINGEWVDAASGKTFDSVNPARRFWRRSRMVKRRT